MAEFTWEARARTGELMKGTMEAETQEVVQSRLRAQQLNPTKVKKRAKEYNLAIFSPVSDPQLVVFTRQFATMIDAGLPLVQCLELLSGQGENKEFNKILRDIKGSVEGGATFSDSLARHPRVFDDLFVNLVAAGEAGGILDTILGRLAVYLEKRVKLRRQVKSAMIYPTAVGGVAVLVVFILLTWVIPAFKDMFSDFGDDSLPALTEFVISISNGFVSNIIWILLAGAATVGGVIYSYKTVLGKSFWHKAMLAAP